MLSPTLIVIGVGLYAKFWIVTAFVTATGDASATVDPKRRSAIAPVMSRMARAASRIRYE